MRKRGKRSMPRDADLPIEPYWLHKDTADFVAEIQRAKYMHP